MSSPVPRSETYEFRFRTPVQWSLNSFQLGLIHVVGLDGTPWPSKVRIDRESPDADNGPVIHVARNSAESGHVFFLFQHPRHGDLLLSTGTLPVSNQHYDLLKELARGTLNRLRNQLSIWEEGGLEIPETVSTLQSQAVRYLTQAIMSESLAEQDQSANEAIIQAVGAIFELSQHFGQQISRYRCDNLELPRFWIGATAPESSFDQDNPILECDFWRVVRPPDACKTSNLGESQSLHDLCTGVGDLPLILGPWLDASQGGFSEALLLLGDHSQRRKTLLANFRSTLDNLPGQVQLLHLVSGINGIGHRHLSYPQLFQLTTELLQLTESSRVQAAKMVSFDFPWAERLASAVGGIHPLQIADSLLRQGFGINYFGLEINLDYWPGGSALRDPFQWIDLIDIWAQLEIPLVLLLRAPFGGTPVPADQPVDRLVNQQRSRTTDRQRLELLEIVLPTMIARPAVHGLLWQQWQDDSDSRFPFGGLVESSGKPKSTSRLLKRLRNWILEGQQLTSD
jgi:hypothetical protein